MAQHVVSMSPDPDRFDPKDVHVKSGDEIVWKNTEPAGGDQHTATSDDGKTFDTDFVNPGKSSAPVTITGKPGAVIPYTCQVHPKHMKGTVTIDS
jgi:plastocyanin